MTNKLEITLSDDDLQTIEALTGGSVHCSNSNYFDTVVLAHSMQLTRRRELNASCQLTAGEDARKRKTPIELPYNRTSGRYVQVSEVF